MLQPLLILGVLLLYIGVPAAAIWGIVRLAGRNRERSARVAPGVRNARTGDVEATR